jgi:predicted nucleic acid-binding protein
MWTLVLDATALVADFRIRSPTTLGLFDRAKTGKLSIVVPEIVVREVVGMFRHELQDARDQVVCAGSKFARLGVSVDVPSLDLGAVVMEYEQFLPSTWTVSARRFQALRK